MDVTSMARVGRGPLAVVAAVSVMLLMAACGGGGDQAASAAAGEAQCRPTFVTAGEKAPDVTLTGLDGKSHPLTSVTEGKVALVDLWATWCAPCVAAMPHLQELYAKYKDKGFVVVGVMSDSNATKLGADGFKDKGVTYPMLLDNDSEAVGCAWGPVVGYPSIVLLDAEGTVVEAWFGGVGVDVIEEKVADLLAMGGVSPKATGAEEAAPVASR